MYFKRFNKEDSPFFSWDNILDINSWYFILDINSWDNILDINSWDNILDILLDNSWCESNKID